MLISIWRDGVITIKPDGKVGLKGARTYGEEDLVAIANNPNLSKNEKIERINKRRFTTLPEFAEELKRQIK